jgi:hypothetical protein
LVPCPASSLPTVGLDKGVTFTGQEGVQTAPASTESQK